MIALAVQHHGLDTLGQVGEEFLEPEHDRIVQRVALFRPRETNNGDVALNFGRDQSGRAVRRRSTHGRFLERLLLL